MHQANAGDGNMQIEFRATSKSKRYKETNVRVWNIFFIAEVTKVSPRKKPFYLNLKYLRSPLLKN